MYVFTVIVPHNVHGDAFYHTRQSNEFHIVVCHIKFIHTHITVKSNASVELTHSTVHS